ncbi:MAG TPA: FAD-binding oxidoreductase, partial [Rhodanobacteraceae bacterium]|nr:FAD-binding oxidoreductase [Rhodanobacteraceae bacterium]
MTVDTRGFALAETGLASFDRQFDARCRVQRPDRYRLLDALPRDVPRIARGSGVSYVAASFGAGAISQSLAAFDRLLAFDEDEGRLVAEAGARIGDVQRFALARGWYLPVTPGHPATTIGGAIAADVHGKNPARDGTFRAVVERIELSTADGGIVVASADENADRFAATFAGFGLAGTITRAVLRLARPPSALILRRVPVANLADAARVLREAANAPVLYGWHDGRGKVFGRGVIRIGLASDVVDARSSRIPPASRDLPATIAPAPIALWNRAGIAAANTWFGAHWRRPGQSPLPLADALFPLNDARGYFAGFGAAGMAEAQWLVPHARFDDFAGALGERVARDRPRIALVASKLFAGAPAGFSFDGAGIALAIQVPAPR